MSVDLSVSGGQAVMTFTNSSQGLGATAVFKEIVVDTCDGDQGAAVLWGAQLVNQPPEVSYSAGDSNGLPGYNDVTSEQPPLLELQADSPPPCCGLGLGESLQVLFQTSLPDGAGIDQHVGGEPEGNVTQPALPGKLSPSLAQ